MELSRGNQTHSFVYQVPIDQIPSANGHISTELLASFLLRSRIVSSSQLAGAFCRSSQFKRKEVCLLNASLFRFHALFERDAFSFPVISVRLPISLIARPLAISASFSSVIPLGKGQFLSQDSGIMCSRVTGVFSRCSVLSLLRCNSMACNTITCLPTVAFNGTPIRFSYSIGLSGQIRLSTVCPLK